MTDNGGGVLRLLFNQGDGTFEGVLEIATGDSPYGVTAADLDGEGHADLVVSHSPLGDQTGHISVLLNKGDGTFQEQVDYATVDNWFASAVDVDGDADLDLVIEDATEKGPLGKYGAVVRLNTGDGTFELTQECYWKGVWLNGFKVSDVDGDGNLDLVGASSDSVYVIPLEGKD